MFVVLLFCPVTVPWWAYPNVSRMGSDSIQPERELSTGSILEVLVQHHFVYWTYEVHKYTYHMRWINFLWKLNLRNPWNVRISKSVKYTDDIYKRFMVLCKLSRCVKLYLLYFLNHVPPLYLLILVLQTATSINSSFASTNYTGQFFSLFWTTTCIHLYNSFYWCSGMAIIWRNSYFICIVWSCEFDNISGWFYFPTHWHSFGWHCDDFNCSLRNG